MMRPWIAVAYSAPVAAATAVFIIYPIGQGSKVPDLKVSKAGELLEIFSYIKKLFFFLIKTFFLSMTNSSENDESFFSEELEPKINNFNYPDDYGKHPFYLRFLEIAHKYSLKQKAKGVRLNKHHIVPTHFSKDSTTEKILLSTRYHALAHLVLFRLHGITWDFRKEKKDKAFPGSSASGERDTLSGGNNRKFDKFTIVPT
jgi:Photosynthetic reaction centre protein